MYQAQAVFLKVAEKDLHIKVSDASCNILKALKLSK